MSWWPFQHKKAEKRAHVLAYQAKNGIKIPGIRDLSLLEYVVLDTETTGLDPSKDFILSFGALKIQNGNLLVSSSLELYPKSPKSPGKSAEIHGLLARENTIDHKAFSELVLPYLGNAILVGQHIHFDKEMLSKICQIPQVLNPSVDTANLALRLEKGPQASWDHVAPKDYSLDALCKRYSIAVEDRHTAAGDAFLTAQLFLKLLKIAQTKNIRTFQDLMRF